MRVVVSFRVVSTVRVQTPLDISDGNKTYRLQREGDKIVSVSVAFSNVPITEAPKISRENESSNLSIGISDRYALIAERDIRAWQSVMAAFKVIDIDFSQMVVSYFAEVPAEDAQIQLTSIKIGADSVSTHSAIDFSIFGRAFLAVNESYDLIDQMAFYIEGTKLLSTSHYVESFNQFYLFLEANFNLPFKTKEAIGALSKNRPLIEAAIEVLVDPLWSGHLKKANVIDPNKVSDVNAFITKIVNLRGKLRHNTLANPNRWNPHNQSEYLSDAVLMAALCQKIAYPNFQKTFDGRYLANFFEQAVEKSHMTSVQLTLTIKESGTMRNLNVNMRFPTRDHGPELAKLVMQKALEEFDLQFTGFEVYSIRATIIETGQELFRYDLGPSIAR